MTFQSTLSVRRATLGVMDVGDSTVISIHALREESDVASDTATVDKQEFQSTLSVRRATVLHRPRGRDRVDFNPRSP